MKRCEFDDQTFLKDERDLSYFCLFTLKRASDNLAEIFFDLEQGDMSFIIIVLLNLSRSGCNRFLFPKQVQYMREYVCNRRDLGHSKIWSNKSKIHIKEKGFMKMTIVLLHMIEKWTCERLEPEIKHRLDKVRTHFHGRQFTEKMLEDIWFYEKQACYYL